MASPPIIYNRERFITIGKSRQFTLSDEIIEIGKQLLDEISEIVSKLPPKSAHYNSSNHGKYSKSSHQSHSHYRKHRNHRHHQPSSMSMNTPLHVIWRNDVNTKIKEDVEKQLKLQLNKLEMVNDVISILNVPLLESSKVKIADILEGLPTLEDDIVDEELVQDEFINSELYRNNLVSEDFKTTAILINLKDNKSLKKLREKINFFKNINNERQLTNSEKNEYTSTKKLLREQRDETRNNHKILIENIRNIIIKYENTGEIFLGGIPMIANDVVEFVKGDLKIFGISILIFLVFTLSIIFRQARWIVLPIITCATSVIITSGIFSLLNWEVTVISSNYISLQLILTMAITIHLIVRYRELALLNRNIKNQADLLFLTLQQMIKPCLFTVLTTIAGFSSLILSGLLPVINFGWMMSVGVSISLLLTFILFPILLKEMNIILPNLTFEKKFNLPQIIASFTEKNNAIILLSAFSILCISFYGIINLKVENSFIDYFKTKTEIYKGMEMIDKKLGGTTLLDVTLDFENKEIPSEITSINRVEEDEIYDEMDDIFDEMMEQDSNPMYWFTIDKMEKIEKIHDYLDSLEETGKVLSFATILKVAKKINDGRDLDSVQLGLLYQKIPEQYKKIIINPYISTEHNQARITLRVKDSEPKLRRNELINKIKNEMPVLLNLDNSEIRLSNILILYNNMLQSLFKSQIMTLGIVILVLFSMFLLLFKSFSISIIAIIPNLLSIGTVLGLMGICKIPLDMMTITIAAISMGIAVDNTIHYIFRHKIEFNKCKDYIKAMKKTHMSIGYALYYTTLTIIMGFSILVFSNFIPSIYFGLLTSLAMIIALLASLTIVPRLLSAFKPYSD